jgi:hypothetical protein
MVYYECYNCGYNSNDKSKLVTHFKRKRLCKSIRENIDLKHCKNYILQGITYEKYIQMTSNNQLLEVIINPKQFLCKYCNKSYKHKTSLYNHYRSCNDKKKADEADNSMDKLVDMLNDQIKSKDGIIQDKNDIIQEMKRNDYIKDKELEAKNKQIEELIKKAGIINNGTLNQGIINNIVINNYSNTDMSHLTDKDIQDSLKRWETCIPNLIEKVHYNPLKPENNNIYISNLKNKKVMLYENNKWETEESEEVLNDIIDKYTDLFEEFKLKLQDKGKNLERTNKRIDNILNHADKSDKKGLKTLKRHISNKLYTNRPLK